MAAESYLRILTRGNESALPSTITDGKLRFTTDTHKLFLDNGNERIEFTDFVKGLTTQQIKAIAAPLPKFYLSSDEGTLWFHDGTNWKSLVADKAVGDKNGNDITTTYAPLSSPALTGAPTTPDVAAGDSSTKIANTNFVANAISNISTATTSSSGFMPTLNGDTSYYMRGDGSWAIPPDNDRYVECSHDTSNTPRPLLLYNGTTATTSASTSSVYRSTKIYADPSDGTLFSDWIKANPAPEVDFDFGVLTSGTTGDEDYGV